MYWFNCSISRIYYNNTANQVIVGSLLGIIMGITYSKYKGIKISKTIINSIIILFIILLYMSCKRIYMIVSHNNECKKNKITDIFIDEKMKYDIEKKFNGKLLKNSNYYDYWLPAIWNQHQVIQI